MNEPIECINAAIFFKDGCHKHFTKCQLLDNTQVLVIAQDGSKTGTQRVTVYKIADIDYYTFEVLKK